MKIPTEKIRIAFIIDAINAVAGTEKQIMEVINRLDPGLFDITLVCLRPSLEPVDFGDSMHFRYLELGVDKLISFQTIWKLFWLARYLGRNNISIVQTYFIDATIFGVLAARLAGVKGIISCKRDMGFNHSSISLLATRLIDNMVTRFMSNSHAVAAFVSEAEKVPMKKFDIIYNGVDIERYVPGGSGLARTDDEKFRSTELCVGILANLNRPVKRVDVFIKAAQAVAQKIDNVRFEIVGDGYLKDSLSGLARELGIETRIIFCGRHTDVRPIISKWDIGVISSDSEGFSNALLELMAFGIPVVATAVGGNPELVIHGETGFLVRKDDPREMSEAICTLLRDRGRAVAMGKRCRELVEEKYSWAKCMDVLQSYYLSLMVKQ